MEPDERRRRLAALRRGVEREDITWWLRRQLEDLADLRRDGRRWATAAPRRASGRRFHRDARLFLVTTVVFGGAALSLYWIDFNLYLGSLGFSPATIGVVATVGSTAGALGGLPGQRAVRPASGGGW